MSTIEVAVAGRGIQVKQGYEKPSAGDVNTCEVSLAIESGGVWDSLPHKRVTFSTRTASVTVDYAPTITVPHEVMASPGALYLTLTGYDADGIEVARTHRMTYPIEVARAGADEGAEPSPATLDVVSRIDAIAADLEQKRDTDYWRGEPGKDADIAGAEAAKNAANKAAEDAIAAAARADNAAINANNSAIKADEAATNADTATTNANAAAANASEKASLAASKAVEAESAASAANNAATKATEAAVNANNAAANANNAANDLRAAAERGDFDGAPGEPGADGYSPIASVTKVGGTATITVTDKNGTTTATVSDGAPGKDGSDAAATDVRIAGKSITADGVADIPIAGGTTMGVILADNSSGSYSTGLVMSDGRLFLKNAETGEITKRGHRIPILANNMDYAVKAAMCDGKGAAWTDAEKLAARERLGIGGSIDITTLTFEEPVNNATLTFQTPKPYSTLIVQFSIPKTPEDTNARACPMYLYVSKQDGSDEKSMYTWINIPNIANNLLNFVGLLSNDNGLWNWQVKGPIDNDYYANSAWIIQLPSYKNPADFIVKERPYVKKIDIRWVSSAFPAGSSITAYGVL